MKKNKSPPKISREVSPEIDNDKIPPSSNSDFTDKNWVFPKSEYFFK